MDGCRVLGLLGLSSAVFVCGISCESSENGSDAATSSTGGSGGNGGSAHSVTSGTGGATAGSTGSQGASGGSGGSGGSDGASSSGESASAGTTTTGTTNLAGAGGEGEGGAAGAPTDVPGPLTCASFPDDDPSERCKPKLRAILSSNEDVGLLRFEYDAGGRPTAVVDAERSDTLHYYTYNDDGQLTRLETDCDGLTRDTCRWRYDFSYGEDGRLQTMDLRYPSSPGTLTTYRYRSDGQLERIDLFATDDAGVRTLRSTAVYEYGDDDLLDFVTEDDDDEDHTEYSYVLEGTRVRVFREDYFAYGSLEKMDIDIFDDLGLSAFGLHSRQGEEGLSFVVDGIQVLRGYPAAGDWVGQVWFGNRFSVSVPNRVFPYRPFDLGPEAIADFSYEYWNVSFARHVAFSDDGLLEHATFHCGSPCQGELDIVRCGGVTIETIAGSSGEIRSDDETNVFYYGCDDFVMPEALPEL